ncbi:MAG: MBL fold metallo-hydrolase [Syntrophomonadaceae bacterium]|jgi:glyoxylase-like metal-dependent hydrolase (beta-lactamase superfamily II)|nr:MBL fold metallo-hydrolase [Syntrophomonadaceae bacterium]
MLIPITDRIKMVKASTDVKLLVANSLLVEDERILLIDAGFGRGNVDTLKDIPVDYLVNSHFHEDHVMFNWLFPRAKLFVPREDAEGISSRQTYIDWYGFQVLDGQAVQDWIFKAFDWREYHTDNLFTEGHKWELGNTTVQALHTPGHTRGHYSFWIEKERILFAADVALTPTGPWYGNITSDVDDFIASIKRLKALKPQVVVSSHRSLIEKNIDEEFDRYLEVIFEREEKLMKYLRNAHTLEEIAAQKFLYGYQPAELVQAFFERVHVYTHLRRLLNLGWVEELEGRYRSTR